MWLHDSSDSCTRVLNHLLGKTTSNRLLWKLLGFSREWFHDFNNSCTRFPHHLWEWQLVTGHIGSYWGFQWCGFMILVTAVQVSHTTNEREACLRVQLSLAFEKCLGKLSVSVWASVTSVSKKALWKLDCMDLKVKNIITWICNLSFWPKHLMENVQFTDILFDSWLEHFSRNLLNYWFLSYQFLFVCVAVHKWCVKCT